MNSYKPVNINPKKTDFYLVLKDIENMFWLFLLSVRTLEDYEIQQLLKTKNSAQESYLCFNDMLDKFNESTNLKTEFNGNNYQFKLNILKEMKFIGKVMTILMYDFLLLSKYNNQINKDEEFQFLRFIRNGAAHNNKFNLKDEKGEWKLEENQIIEWNGFKINRKLQGNKVFNDFISLNEIFLLANYFSEKLKDIDLKKKK